MSIEHTARHAALTDAMQTVAQVGRLAEIASALGL
jgi:hypothetical protein